MKKKYLLLSLIGVLFLAGCFFDKPQDNVMYPAEHQRNVNRNINVLDLFIESEGINRFVDIPANVSFNNENIIVSISPDNKSVYLLKPSVTSKPAPKQQVIKGNTPVYMSLYRKDLETNKEELLLQKTQLITTAKWNNKGNILAMTDGEKLSIYDAVKRKFIMEDKLSNNQVVTFGFSPDGNKIYTEHPNLPNGSIVYLDSETILHAYENSEELYYKGKLDDNYYFGTYIASVSERELKDRGRPTLPQTVVVAKDGQIIKLLGEGRFRSAHDMSILQVDEARFGLSYIPDINNPSNVVRLTDKYVHHADFAYNGMIAYTVNSDNSEKNEFIFNIFDPKTKKTIEFIVNNGIFIVSPDGKTAYISGLYEETVDFVNLKHKTSSPSSQDTSTEQQKIIRTIRLAVDTFSRFELNGEKDMNALAKSFIDSSSPEQWAYFDISTYFNDMQRNETNNHYVVNAYIENLIINGNRASVFIGFTGINSFGSGWGEGWAAELIKQNNNWYITGLSTFPNSKEANLIYTQVEKLIKNPTHPKLLELKDKNVEIGQIQFWALSEPHRAGSVEWANYCKIFLKVKDNEEETIYKLVLRKENKTWLVDTLNNQNLSGLW